MVAKEAKSIQVQVTPEPHQLVVQAKGYKKRVLSVVPPYGATFAQNVTFTMGDQVVALE